MTTYSQLQGIREEMSKLKLFQLGRLNIRQLNIKVKFSCHSFVEHVLITILYFVIVSIISWNEKLNVMKLINLYIKSVLFILWKKEKIMELLTKFMKKL